MLFIFKILLIIKQLVYILYSACFTHFQGHKGNGKSKISRGHLRDRLKEKKIASVYSVITLFLDNFYILNLIFWSDFLNSKFQYSILSWQLSYYLLVHLFTHYWDIKWYSISILLNSKQSRWVSKTAYWILLY